MGSAANPRGFEKDMRLLFRGDPDALRSSFSFSASGITHAVLLALVAFGRPSAPAEKPRSLYDTVIRPEERRLVWYHLQDKLPDVRSTAAPPAHGRPLRATKKFDQRIVAGPKDDARTPQLVWSPAPEIAASPATPLPNVLAVEMKRLVRPFLPPAAKQPATANPVLPDAPPVAASAAAAGQSLRPLVKPFTRPPVKIVDATKFPDAEARAVGLPAVAAPAGPSLSPLRKSFTPPSVKITDFTKFPDAEARAVGLPGGAAPAGPNLSPLRKTFTPPPVKTADSTKLPDAEARAIGLPGGEAPAGPNLSPLRKTFTLPAAAAAAGSSSAHATEPPSIPIAAPATDVPQLAIIGLNPAKVPDLPAPPASRTAGFSAGPKLEPNGAESDGDAAGIPVPGVTVRDGGSRQALLAAIRPVVRSLPAEAALPPPPATRVSSAPDPALNGRVVYTLSIQMPNVTSYSGSWLVWFAEREQAGAGTMRAPEPRRKVDPKYIASAVADGVEGIVRLGAVIRKNGHVDSVTLLRHLDDRLDKSAMESLVKWEFEPAVHGGAPVDVDAVFEIPFRLAPKPLK
jgi:TonB family protein